MLPAPHFPEIPALDGVHLREAAKAARAGDVPVFLEEFSRIKRESLIEAQQRLQAVGLDLATLLTGDLGGAP